MCEHDKAKTGIDMEAGSRRRRLWELPTNCHCPVIGVCLPLALLRKLVNKVALVPVQGDDYDVHVLAVHECANRNPLSEQLQRTLDERFAVVLRQFRSAKDENGVSMLWRHAVERGDVAGAFWAALTHPRCGLRMIEAIVRDMHMIQHQTGARVHVDLDRFAALQKQNTALATELVQTRDKSARAIDCKARELARQAEQASQLRAELAQRDAVIDSLRRELEQLQAALPDLRDRERLLQRVVELEARARSQTDKLAQLRHRIARERQEPAPVPPAAAAEPVVRPLLNLSDKTVLCVGGRSGNVPNYRDLLEKEGARFMHHDGGLEQASDLLDTSLAAADIVICQTGCISHQAYWRVKDFCKRTGKRCLFVENPSTSSLSSCLRNAVAPVEQDAM
jgi:hypothetical protein